MVNDNDWEFVLAGTRLTQSTRKRMKRGGTSGLVGLYRVLRETKGDNAQRVRIPRRTLKLRRENEFKWYGDVTAVISKILQCLFSFLNNCISLKNKVLNKLLIKILIFFLLFLINGQGFLLVLF